ncbi:hypothetical protein IAT38_003769 [Cryptococcus sp. DSM 104549]
MSKTDYKFEGWAGENKDSVNGNLKWIQYEPKEFAEDDVDIKILYCGICASDVSTLNEGWMPMGHMYPQVVGHEIVGEVVRVGSKVTHLKVGDIAGVGAQCDSCRECEWCQAGEENYCHTGMTGTYNDKFKRTSAGSKTYGGYANYWRGPSHFTFLIPAGLDPAFAAPMLCGGVTVYTPLKQYGAGTTAKKVGVVGIGGLGHFAVLFAKAMGAEVTAISHGESKREDAAKLGADHFLVSGDDAKKAFKGKARTLDLIICTSNDKNMPMDAYLSLLRPKGNFILVGVPETGLLAPTAPFTLIMNNVHIGGSSIGSPATIREMLQLAADQKIHPWIKKYKMDDVNQALPDQIAGKARFRYVLVNEKNGAKL